VTRLLNGALFVLEVVLVGAVLVLLAVAGALTIFFGVAWGLGGG
jgi:hypothetical protein